MTRAFAAALNVVLHHEGGYVDHPKDPGGRTNMGITQATLDRVRERDWFILGNIAGDVRELTRDDAALIYREEYWSSINGDELPDGVALILFDCAVNQGVHRAITILQAALGVEPDGVFGSKTRRILAMRNPADLIREIAARRAWAYMKLDSLDDTFGLGWARRLFDVYDHAQKVSA